MSISEEALNDVESCQFRFRAPVHAAQAGSEIEKVVA